MNRAPVNELLEQGKNALAALRYREQVAVYRAAIASLHSALLKAEGGDQDPLETWLQNYRSLLLVNDVGDLPHLEAGPGVEESLTPSSPWAAMAASALARNRLPVASQESESTCSDTISEIEERPLSVDWENELGDSREFFEAVVEESQEFEIDEAKSAQLETTLPTARSHLNWKEWIEPPVWASIAGHSVAIGILSLFVIRHMQEPSVSSIVSATYEGEAILTEAPMESIGPVSENLTDLGMASEIPESMPMELLENSGLIGSRVESLALDGVGAIGGENASSLGGIGQGGLSQGISSESLSRVVQASSMGTGGTKTVQGAEFFGVKATGNLFIYVVDCSPSMRRENAFEAAKVEIARSLKSMKASQRYYIYFFAKEIERMESERGVAEESPLYATPDNVKRTLEWLGRTRIQREGWPPNNVLSEAITMSPDGIFLLFDGDTRVDVAKHLSSVNRVSDLLTPESPKAPIHVVHFFAEQFAGPMRKIAVENSGTYRFIPRTARSGR